LIKRNSKEIWREVFLKPRSIRYFVKFVRVCQVWKRIAVDGCFEDVLFFMTVRHALLESCRLVLLQRGTVL
jgi:hypothetical protein